mmetsp:Transcript_52810/g.83857  ORF Transcript_52810/g.83857 Transcript_52810/m.83857 type:complete len:249 (+) Transcript_52810:365-1111(+)
MLIPKVSPTHTCIGATRILLPTFILLVSLKITTQNRRRHRAVDFEQFLDGFPGFDYSICQFTSIVATFFTMLHHGDKGSCSILPLYPITRIRKTKTAIHFANALACIANVVDILLKETLETNLAIACIFVLQRRWDFYKREFESSCNTITSKIGSSSDIPHLSVNRDLTRIDTRVTFHGIPSAHGPNTFEAFILAEHALYELACEISIGTISYHPGKCEHVDIVLSRPIILRPRLESTHKTSILVITT